MINRRAFFQALAGVPVAAAVVAKAAPPQTSFMAISILENWEKMGLDYVPQEVIVTDGEARIFGGRIVNVSRSTP